MDRHSRLYVWQKALSADIVRTEQLGVDLYTLEERHAWHGDDLRPSEYVYLDGEDETCAHAWELTRLALVEMARETREAGSVLSVVLLPCSQLVHREEWDHLVSVAGEAASRLDPELPARRLASIAEQVGARFVDATPAFRAAAPSRSELVREEWLFLNGRGHLNEAGNAVLGHVLAAEARAAP